MLVFREGIMTVWFDNEEEQRQFMEQRRADQIDSLAGIEMLRKGGHNCCGSYEVVAIYDNNNIMVAIGVGNRCEEEKDGEEIYTRRTKDGEEFTVHRMSFWYAKNHGILR